MKADPNQAISNKTNKSNVRIVVRIQRPFGRKVSISIYEEIKMIAIYPKWKNWLIETLPYIGVLR